MTALIGRYKVEQVRENKVIETIEGTNSITYEGASHLLNMLFRLSTINTNGSEIYYYIGLITQQYTSNQSPVAIDTASTLTYIDKSFVPFTGIYNNVLPKWEPAAAALTNGKMVLRNTPTQIRIVLSSVYSKDTVAGIFIANRSNPYAYSTGTGLDLLWATMLFKSPITVYSNDVLNITYAVEMV